MRLNEIKIIAIAIMLGAIGGGGFFAFMQLRSATFVDKTNGVSFSYNKAFADNTYSAPEGVIAYLIKSKPAVNITLAVEKQTDKGLKAAETSSLDKLESDISTSMPKQYPGYTSTSKERTKIAGYEALKHSFTYDNAEGRAVSGLLAIVPRGQSTYYLTILSINKSAISGAEKQITDTLKLP